MHIFYIHRFTSTFGQKSKTNSDSLHGNNPVSVNRKELMGSLVKKNELSAEVGQLFLIKSCQSQWKVFEKKSTTKQ